MSEQWYYSKNGNKEGPVSTSQLQALAKEGTLRPTDTVWSERVGQWVPATRVNGLFPAGFSSAPPPVAPPHPVGQGPFGFDPSSYATPVSQRFKNIDSSEWALSSALLGFLVLICIAYA